MSGTNEWPAYEAPPKDHMHALGVISVNYNSFENVLYAIFRNPLISNGVPDKLSEYVFSEFNRQQQVEAMRVVFASYEKDPEIIDRITHLLAYFHWCYEARDTLMHAHHDKSSGGSPARLSLSKRSKGDFAKFNFMFLSLAHLRAIADHMHEGYLFALELFAFLEHRSGRIPSFLKDFYCALPSKPRIPKKIKLRDSPEAP